MSDVYTLVKSGVIKVTKSRWTSAEHRFWSHVEKNGPIHQILGTRCWVWTGVKQWGYGIISDAGKPWKAHRWSYRYHRGDLPDNLVVCHKCDNRECVNPGHLFLGTHQDNFDDMKSKDRSARGERHRNAKLTDEDVKFIRNYRGDMTRYDLADKFGVKYGAITAVLNRTTWKHLK